MADLDDLGYPSITDQSTDEALETIRQIRLSRRTPTAKPKKATKAKKKKEVPKMSANDAEEILKLLGG